MKTEFLPIRGYEGMYEINEKGIVRRPKRIGTDAKGRKHTFKEQLIKSRIDHRSGYPVVKFYQNSVWE